MWQERRYLSHFLLSLDLFGLSRQLLGHHGGRLSGRWTPDGRGLLCSDGTYSTYVWMHLSSAALSLATRRYSRMGK
jgi:hypothetical protein